MTKEEILSRIKEIEQKIKDNNYRWAQLDVAQKSKKKLINSSYGAISSRSNPIGDDDLANAITVMGSTSIKKVNKIALEYVNNVRVQIAEEKEQEAKELFEKDKDNPQTAKLYNKAKLNLEHIKKNPVPMKEVLVYNDTDSMGASLSACGVEICKDNKVTEKGYEIVDGFEKYVNDEFVKWYEQTTNSHRGCLYFKREKISDHGIWLLKKDGDSEAKKNYVLHCLDNEGNTHPKFKYTGVKFARSVIPSILKEEGKKVVENLILKQDQESTDEMVRELFEKYKKMPLEDKSTIQRCNNVEKYDNGQDEGYELRTPGHIRAALNYNRVIKKLGIKRLVPIRSGDTIKIVFLETPNQFGIDKIGFVDEWPKEFNQYFKVDEVTGFNKIIYDEIKRFYQTAGWTDFNPSENYNYSLQDILSMN